MKKNNNKNILIIVGLLVFSLIGSVFLSTQRQDTRGGAYFGGTKVSIQPETLNKAVGDNFTVQLYVNPTTSSSVDFIESKVCIGEGMVFMEDEAADNLALGEGFSEVVKAQFGEDKKCLLFGIRSDKVKKDLPTGGAIKALTIKLKATESKTGNITVDKTSTTVSGYNPNLSSRDLAIEVTETSGTKYVIGAGGDDEDEDDEDEEDDEDGDSSTISFKVNTKKIDKDPKCAKKEKLTITVMGGEVSKVYKDVEVSWDGSAYKGSKKLIGLTQSKNLAVFIKGSKSLQVKYGKDNQNSAYNKAGGEIDLSVDKTYNFSAFPLLQGDVMGEGDKQDGVINGRDFSYVKTQAAKRETTTEGRSLLADLDGNCQVNSVDVSVLMLSLEDKMDQLY